MHSPQVMNEYMKTETENYITETIVCIVSRWTQLISMDVLTIPVKIRQTTKFVLIINENLKIRLAQEMILAYDKIYFVPMNLENQLNVMYIEEDFIWAVADIYDKYKNILAFTSDEMNLEFINIVLSKFKIANSNKNVALLCRDKIQMKEHMQKFQIRVPKFLPYKNSMSFDEISAVIGLPFVLKPNSLAASVGFFKISNVHDYANFLAQFNNDFTYEAEEFITGTLYHIDSIKYKNEVVFTVAEYLSPAADSLSGKLHGSVEVIETNKYYLPLIDFNQKVLASIESDGCFHHEVFINQYEEIVFLEIAWRSAGSVAGSIFKQHYGFSQNIYEIMLHLGVNQAEFVGLRDQAEEYYLNFLVPKLRGDYYGIYLPKLNGKCEVKHIISLSTYVDNDAWSCIDASAEIFLRYPSFKESYDLIYQDFIILRKLYNYDITRSA